MNGIRVATGNRNARTNRYQQDCAATTRESSSTWVRTVRFETRRTGRGPSPWSNTAAGNRTPQDGWTLPEDIKKVPDAAKKWLRDNADSYRIQRYVTTKKTEPGK